MFTGLLDYLEHRKRLREERRARKKRRAKFRPEEFTAAKLREYPETLQVVQAMREEGATHFEYDPMGWEIIFYRLYGGTLQERRCTYAFTGKPRRGLWQDVRKPLDRLEAIQKHTGATESSDPVHRLYLAQEKHVKEWLSTWPSVPPRTRSIEELFEPGGPRVW